MDPFLNWLTELSLDQHHGTLVENGIDLSIAAELTEADLAGLGLVLGDRKRFLLGVRQLGRAAALAEAPVPFEPAPRPADGDGQERRQLTLMFVDLVGSTALAHHMELEDYREALHIYQKCCLDAIRARHGFVAQFLGDGVVAYFGYPAADETDAECAVLAGLDICRSIREVDAPGGVDLQVRIGIATGDVLIDPFLDQDVMTAGLALGDTPALAARLQGAAEPGSVAISAATRRMLGRSFVCRALGSRTFKGFDDPIEVWIVSDYQDLPLRYQSRHGDRALPLIDREDEIYLLDSRWRAARRGEGQAVFLAGEAGIGKSRLVDAVADHLAGEEAITLSLQCSPYRDVSALFPVISLIAHSAGFVREDSPVARLDKLARLVGHWQVPDPDALAILAGLLDLPSDGRFQPVDPGEDSARRRLQSLLVSIAISLSERSPVLLIVEDLHWVDPSTEELLDLLIERIATARLLLLGTFRPGYTCRWEGRARVTTMTISRLDGQNTQALVRNLVSGDGPALPPDLEEQIIAKTDGVPLFVEEMVRMVRRRLSEPDGVWPRTDTLALPSTLKDLLRAQIDSLPSARDIVPVCAAIGRSVHPGLLQSVSGLEPGEIEPLLDQLVQAQILVPRGSGADASYFFRHALIQDAAYEAMLPSRARVLHRRIAEALSTLFADIAEASPEILAQHYTRARMAVEARDAWRRAAGQATSRSAGQETMSHLRSALQCNESAPEDTRDTAEIELRKMIAVALHLRSFASPEHTENYERLNELAERTGGDRDPTHRFVVLHGAFGRALMRGDPRTALAACPEMLTLADDSASPTLQMLAAHDHGMAAFMLADFTTARQAFQTSIDRRADTTTEEILRLYPADIRLVDRSMQIWARALDEGDSPGMRAEIARWLTAVADETHTFSRCYAMAVTASATQTLDDPSWTFEIATGALELSLEAGFDYWESWSRCFIGWARARTGDPETGIAEIAGAIDAYLAGGSSQLEPWARTMLAEAHLMAGDTDEGLEIIARIRRTEREKTVRFQVPYTDRVEAALKAAS